MGRGRKHRHFTGKTIPDFPLPGHSHHSLMLYADGSGSSNYVLAHSTPLILLRKIHLPLLKQVKQLFYTLFI